MSRQPSITEHSSTIAIAHRCPTKCHRSLLDFFKNKTTYFQAETQFKKYRNIFSEGYAAESPLRSSRTQASCQFHRVFSTAHLFFNMHKKKASIAWLFRENPNSSCMDQVVSTAKPTSLVAGTNVSVGLHLLRIQEATGRYLLPCSPAIMTPMRFVVCFWLNPRRTKLQNWAC